MPRAPKYLAVAPSALAPSPENLFIGTSGWSYPTWKPDFYPAEVPVRAFLHFYSSQFQTVEVNQTFRSLPTQKAVQSWVDAVPPGFRFAFKAPEQITHRQRLVDCHDAVAQFYDAVSVAKTADKLGPLLFQLPPNFKADASRLSHLLSSPALANGLQVAIEFRNASWFTGDTFAILRKYSVALCVADSDDLETPDVVTAAFRYYRFRQTGGYSSRELNVRAKVLEEAAQNSNVFVYLKHEEAPTGALNARQLLKQTLKLRDQRKQGA